MNKQVFVSYSREDRSSAERLAKALQPGGWSVWWDRHIPAGSRYDVAIAERLASVDCVLVLWSKASIRSEWVVEEAEAARERGVLVPVLLEAVEPPLGFRRIQSANLIDWDGTVDAPAFDQLVQDIDAILSRRLGAKAAVAVPFIAPVTEAAAIPTGPAAPISRPAAVWDAPTIQEIEQQLSDVVGPVAPVLLSRAMRDATDLPDLLAALDRHVSSALGYAKFVREDGVANAAPPVPPCAVGPSPPTPSPETDDGQLKIADAKVTEIENALACYIGPIAKFAVKQAILQSKSPDEVRSTLLMYIERDDERRQFSATMAHII